MRVSVVLPCLNEIESVGAVVREVRDTLARGAIDGEIVVVDNGSTDGSDRAAADAGARVVRESRRGYGNAYLAGFEAATGDVVVMADADGTYDFSALPRFLERIDDGDDLVVGMREIEPNAMPWFHRHVGNPALSFFVRVLHHGRVTDAYCGMRAIRRDALDRLHLRQPGMELALEMLVRASRAHMRVSEIPIRYRVRVGESKLRTVRDGWRSLRFLVLALWTVGDGDS